MTATVAAPPVPPAAPAAPWWPEVYDAVARLARVSPTRPAVIDATGAVTFELLWNAARRQHSSGPSAETAEVVPVPARSTVGFFVDVVAALLRGQAALPLPGAAAGTSDNSPSHPQAAGGCRPWKAVVAVAGGTYTTVLTHGEPPTRSRKAEALGLRPGGVAFFASPMHLNGPYEFAVRHLLSGGTIVLAQRFDPGEWAATARRCRPDWAFLVPTQMRRLLANVDPGVLRDATASLRLLVHSSEPCPPPLRAGFADLLGAERIAEYYGTATYDGTLTIGRTTGPDGEPGGRRAAAPIPGALLRVVDGTGRPVPPGVTGRIEGRSTAGLVSHPAGRCPGPGDWQSVGDLGRLTADGRLVLESVAAPGRAIVGGINVPLGQVRSVITAHPGVLDCDVTAVPDPDLGSVVAVHARVADPALTADALGAYCAERLSAAERPRRIDLVTVNAGTGRWCS